MTRHACPHCSKDIVEPDGPARTVLIVRDEHPCDPRKEYDNLGTMVCFHRRYDLGDVHHGLRCEDFIGWADLERHLRDELDAVVVLPVFIHDHSGITISTESYADPWDSGQIGFIYITRAKAIEEYGANACTPEQLGTIARYLQAEVELYDDYLTGNCYGYIVYNENGEETDSCSGFYGCDIETNGIKEYVQSYLDEGYELQEE